MKAPEKFLLALVAALALLLAGCGGGSNNDDDGEEMSDPPRFTCADGMQRASQAACEKAAADKALADQEAEEEAKAEAEKATADASALYAKLVAMANVPSSLEVGPGVKDEHKAIETIRGEDGATWLEAIASGGALQSLIGDRVTTGDYVGYWLIEGGAGVHTVEASEFTERVGLAHKKDASYSGSYRGIEGTFKCTGDGCTSSPATGENMFTLSSGNWHFKPNNDTDKLPGNPVAQWGWWMGGMSTPATGDDTINILYRHGTSNNPTEVRQAFPPAGSATYTGNAHGQYAVVDGADSMSGAFKATAMLEAKFSGGSTKLSGKVHNFDVGSNWEVMLKENSVNHAAGVFTGKTVWKTGDEDGLGEGDWDARLYGGTENAEATHALGGFTATDTGARMVGAFGATPPKQE